MRIRLKGALPLMSVENLSTGTEASASGESLNSGDPAIHPAARHRLRPERGFAGRFGQRIHTYLKQKCTWYGM